MSVLKEKKCYLKQFITKGIEPTFKALEDAIAAQSVIRNELLLFQGQYQRAKLDDLNGLQSASQTKQDYARIRMGLLALIDQLTPKDIGLETIIEDLSPTEIPPGLLASIDKLDNRIARMNDRLIRIKGTDITQEMKLEEEMEELRKLRSTLLNQS